MKVFVVGDLCLDVLCNIREHAALGEEKHIYNLNFSLGGNAANFSFAASKLGFDVELHSAIGKDFATAFLKKQLLKTKVSLFLSGKLRSKLKSHMMIESIHVLAVTSRDFRLIRLEIHSGY